MLYIVKQMPCFCVFMCFSVWSLLSISPSVHTSLFSSQMEINVYFLLRIFTLVRTEKMLSVGLRSKNNNEF